MMAVSLVSKFKTGQRVSIASYMDKLPKWISRSTLVKRDGSPTVVVNRLKKFVVSSELPISESDLMDSVRRSERLAKKYPEYETKKRKGSFILKNLVAYSVAKSIKSDPQSKDMYARWVPSSSKNPSDEHMLNYGKVFRLSDGLNGELPQERPNCQCSMIIISKSEYDSEDNND